MTPQPLVLETARRFPSPGTHEGPVSAGFVFTPRQYLYLLSSKSE